MALLTDPQLRNYTNEVVTEHIAQQTPLTEGVVKIADREKLNEEQVRRLVEASNNETFLRRFQNAEKQGSSDRVVTFEPADADAALSRLVDAAKDVMKAMQPSCHASSSDDKGDLPLTRADAPEPLADAPTKESPEPKVSGRIVIMRLQKSAAQLQSEELEHRHRYTDELQQLSHYFMRQPETHSAFEKDAFYHWGNQAAPQLQLLRTALRKPAAAFDRGQMHKVARVIDTDTAPMRRMNILLEHTDRLRTLRAGQERITQWLDQMNDFQ